MRDRLPGEEVLQHLEGLLQDREPFPWRTESISERLELLRHPSGAEPEIETPARDEIERGRRPREERGVSERGAQDERSEPPDPVGDGRDAGRVASGSSDAIGDGSAPYLANE